MGLLAREVFTPLIMISRRPYVIENIETMNYIQDYSLMLSYSSGLG
jgi:hypothetical protein